MTKIFIIAGVLVAVAALRWAFGIVNRENFPGATKIANALWN